MTDNGQGTTDYDARDREDGELDMLAARQAVERARRQVARAGGLPQRAVAGPPGLDADTEAAASVETALDDARRRARRPFGARARERVAALELAKRLVGDRTSAAAERGSSASRRPNGTARGVDGKAGRNIDLIELGTAYRELTLAEDQLARLLFSARAAVAPSSGSALPDSPGRAT